MARYELTENEFRLIEPLITYKPPRGRPPTKVREMFNAIMWILCSGAKWRDLPERHPPWKSVYHRFRYYQKHGILEQVVEALMQKASQKRQIQLTLVCIDGSYIRAHRHAAGARKKTGSPRRPPQPNKRSDVPGAASPVRST
jgi:Transposase and inactivated derivatives